jgi:hypothetical protein
MKTFSKVNKSSPVLMAALACMMLAESVSVFAVPVSQVARDLTGRTISAECCVLLGPMVRVTEPTVVTPVALTWSTDYPVNNEIRFGLSVNGGTCTSYGPTVGPALSTLGGSGFVSTTYQWVVLPSDGLRKGVNTFAVCGGGIGSFVTITIGHNTLAVQISK